MFFLKRRTIRKFLINQILIHMRKLFTLFLALAASVGTMFAESGTCGENLTWDLTNGVLTISGTGAMSDYEFSNMPWTSLRSSITSVVISNGVTSIGNVAFYDCDKITSVTIGNSVTSIGDYAFSQCTGLTSVTIPSSVTSIGSEAFYDCTGLTSVTIGISVTSIVQDAFVFCTALKAVYILDLTAWCNIAFGSSRANPLSEAKHLYLNGVEITDLVIPNSVTSIGDYAFYDCTGLTSIEIPNSVISIGSGAFSGCTGLISVTIPNSVISIGEEAFCGCSGLTSIEISNSVTSIGELAFSGCIGLTSIPIPNSVTSIGENAFSGCTGLTSVTIPSSVTSIGNFVFVLCSNLTSIIVEKGNTIYDSRGNCNAIIETATNTLIAGCQNTVIPNSVTSIGSLAFAGCSSLASVTIPNSVTSIEDAAFHSCTGLTSVSIGDGVTNIGVGAFAGCSGLTSVTCYATNPPVVGEGIWYEVDCSQIPLYVLVGSIDSYKTANLWKEFTNILPISAEDAEANTLKTEPTDTSVEVTWPVVTGAYTYELVIKDKSGNVICTLVFNANGQLQSIAFNAPGRNAAQQTQSAGFAFTVTGLESGTTYDLTITAKNGGGSTLDTKTVSFTTESAQGINQITNDQSQMTNKIIRNGNVFILRGDKTYSITGQEVK